VSKMSTNRCVVSTLLVLAVTGIAACKSMNSRRSLSQLEGVDLPLENTLSSLQRMVCWRYQAKSETDEFAKVVTGKNMKVIACNFGSPLDKQKKSETSHYMNEALVMDEAVVRKLLIDLSKNRVAQVKKENEEVRANVYEQYATTQANLLAARELLAYKQSEIDERIGSGLSADSPVVRILSQTRDTLAANVKEAELKAEQARSKLPADEQNKQSQMPSVPKDPTAFEYIELIGLEELVKNGGFQPVDNQRFQNAHEDLALLMIKHGMPLQALKLLTTGGDASEYLRLLTVPVPEELQGAYHYVESINVGNPMMNPGEYVTVDIYPGQIVKNSSSGVFNDTGTTPIKSLKVDPTHRSIIRSGGAHVLSVGEVFRGGRCATPLAGEDTSSEDDERQKASALKFEGTFVISGITYNSSYPFHSPVFAVDNSNIIGKSESNRRVLQVAHVINSTAKVKVSEERQFWFGPKGYSFCVGSPRHAYEVKDINGMMSD